MIRSFCFVLLLLSLPAVVHAQEPEAAGTVAQPSTVEIGLDTLLLLFGSALVFLMQPGFALLEMGLIRAKNTMNVVMKNVLDFAGSTIAFLLFGFTLMFGTSVSGFVGLDLFWLSSFEANSRIWAFLLFQSMFVATCCTIASGAMAERTRFFGYLIYSFVMAGFFYPILGHWVWGSYAGGLAGDFGGSLGWLEKLGFHDFAGGTVVHAVGGAAALAGIIVVGPRKDKFDSKGNPRILAGHNLPLAALGVFFLWFGWFGFNGASVTDAGPEIGRVVVNTIIASASGAIFSLAFFWAIQGTPNPLVMLNGILGGLVAATSCADVVVPAWMILIGAIGGIIATSGHLFLEHKLKLDDAVGAVSVHLFTGVWGSLCVGLFHESGFDLKNVITQGFGVLIVSACSFLVSLVLFKLIDLSVGLRADDEEQDLGLDFTEHAVNSYPDFRTTER